MTINPKYAFKLALGYEPNTPWSKIIKQPVSVKKQSEYKRTKEYSHDQRAAILEEMLEVGADEVMKKYRLSRGALTTWSKKLHGVSYAQFADSRGKGFNIRRYSREKKMEILKELDQIGWPALKKKYRHLDKQQIEIWHAKLYGVEIIIPPLDSHGRPKKEK
jgi:hypothetical protein